GIRDFHVTGVQTCALPICLPVAACCAYQHMHVWDAEGTGQVSFDAASLSEVRLGHIVENYRIQQALLDSLADTTITLFGSQSVRSEERRVGKAGSAVVSSV